MRNVFRKLTSNDSNTSLRVNVRFCVYMLMYTYIMYAFVFDGFVFYGGLISACCFFCSLLDLRFFFSVVRFNLIFFLFCIIRDFFLRLVSSVVFSREPSWWTCLDLVATRYLEYASWFYLSRFWFWADCDLLFIAIVREYRCFLNSICREIGQSTATYNNDFKEVLESFRILNRMRGTVVVTSCVYANGVDLQYPLLSLFQVYNGQIVDFIDSVLEDSLRRTPRPFPMFLLIDMIEVTNLSYIYICECLYFVSKSKIMR